MHRRRLNVREILSIILVGRRRDRVRIRNGAEGAVWKNKSWRARSNGPCRSLPRKRLQDGAQQLRIRGNERGSRSRVGSAGNERLLQECGSGHDRSGCLALILAQPFVIDEKEQLLFDERSAQSHSVLSHAEWGNAGTISEITRIQNGIAKVSEDAAVKIIRTGFCYHVNLPASLRAILGVVEGAIDAILCDRIFGNLQSRLRLLRLFLNSSGVHAIE